MDMIIIHSQDTGFVIAHLSSVFQAVRQVGG